MWTVLKPPCFSPSNGHSASVRVVPWCSGISCIRFRRGLVWTVWIVLLLSKKMYSFILTWLRYFRSSFFFPEKYFWMFPGVTVCSRKEGHNGVQKRWAHWSYGQHYLWEIHLCQRMSKQATCRVRYWCFLWRKKWCCRVNQSEVWVIICGWWSKLWLCLSWCLHSDN